MSIPIRHSHIGRVGIVLMLDVKLVVSTPEPELVVYCAARTCYSESAPTLEEAKTLSRDKVRALLASVLSSGHTSVLEHVSFTFAVSGLSRISSHQLVRHRLASYSQRSQRYVKEFGPAVVVPESVREDAEKKALFDRIVNCAFETYNELVELGVPKEDARYILPHGWETELTMTMNGRELNHFISIRSCRRAQWEIRNLALRLYGLVQPLGPSLFENALPGCLKGGCREHRPCGTPWTADLWDQSTGVSFLPTEN